MTPNLSRTLTRLAVLTAMLTIGACSTPTVPVRYYSMQLDTATPASPSPSSQPAPRIRVAIAPVTLPDSVDRPNLVLRSSPTRLEVLDNDRWADGLKREISRLISTQLNATQNRAELSYYPQAAAETADYELALDVQTFDAERGKQVSIALRWTLRSLHDTPSYIRSGQAQASEACKNDTLDAIIEADARALQRIAAELARVMNALPGLKAEAGR